MSVKFIKIRFFIFCFNFLRKNSGPDPNFPKDHAIKNRIYKVLKKLEDRVCKFIKTLTPEIIKKFVMRVMLLL
jgi:hypothetical protein